MKYEIVKLEKKIVVGISARTNNTDPQMGMIIGGLWNRFYQEGMYSSIPAKVNEKALGIYTDYAEQEHADYTVMIGCEVLNEPVHTENLEIRKIPAGTYARFIVKGDVQKAVKEFWQELWDMDLPRAYQYDFEEYQDGELEHAEIHIYISLKA